MFKSVFRTGIRATYSVSDNPSFVSEPWSVYPAKHKSSGKHASVFIFDKTKFESHIHKLCQVTSNSKNPKVIISECYELIKFEISQLCKLRHPQILTVLEVLEETKTKFLFATEAVNNNLVTINMNKNLDNLTIQKGLLQVSKGLQFLHNLCSIVHFNLQPSSIFIDSQGDWKLSGFMFLKNLNEITPQERDNFYIMSNSSIVPFANLNLNYTAPEILIDCNSKLDYANDLWSLGCLIYYLYNEGDTLIHCFDSSNVSDYKSGFKKFENKFYNHRPSELKYLLKNVPSQLYPIYPEIMARYPTDRITIDQFIDSNFFNGSLIKAMLFIDEFTTKSLDDKRVFMKGLLETDKTSDDILAQLPARFKSSKFIPLLIDVITKELNVIQDKKVDSDTEDLLCSSLAVTFKIGSGLSSLTFQDKIFAALLKDESRGKKYTSIAKRLINLSIGIRLVIVENISILREKLSKAQFTTLSKELINLALGPIDTNELERSVLLQEQLLKELPSFIDIYDFPYIKTSLFPAICSVFKSTSVLTTKLLTIETFEALVDKNIIDKLIVNEQLFPVLKNLKSRDKRVVSQVLKLFLTLTSNEQNISLEIETSIELVLPQALNLAFGCNDCSTAEFESFMSIIETIQKSLIEKKMAALPDHSSQTFSTNVPEDKFDSLIKSQKVTEAKRDDILKAPQSKDIMQPKRNYSPINSSVSQNGKSEFPQYNSSTMSKGFMKNSDDVLSPQSTMSTSNIQQTGNNTSRTSKIQPLSLKTNIPPTKQKVLLIDKSVTPNNNRLLQTLNVSSLSQGPTNNDDDEFEDFQVAPKPSTSQPSQNEFAFVAAPETTNTTSYPPGFNMNLVLTPSSVKPRNESIQNKSDPLDLI